MSDSEEDYLSAKFLEEQPSKSTSKPRDYASIRREAQRASEAKQVANKASNMSRRERERAAREEGLSRNLISDARIAGEGNNTEAGAGASSSNKALDIMRKMGFKPGQALGVQQPETQDDNTSETTAESSRKRAVPLEIRMREGRGGLGTEKPSPKRQRVEVEEHHAESAQSYTQTQRGKADDRKATGRLKAAQRTCRELDLRAGSKGSVLWLDPDDVAQEERRKLHAIRMGERELDEDDILAYGEVPLALEDEEKEEWLSLDVHERLARVLDHLRTTHHYCIHCGAQYDDAHQLEEMCPGTAEEEDH